MLNHMTAESPIAACINSVWLVQIKTTGAWPATKTSYIHTLKVSRLHKHIYKKTDISK